jgi:hypothetical protein
MSDEQGPAGPADAGRKRPGPTIDLKATEITGESGAKPPSAHWGLIGAATGGVALALMIAFLAWPSGGDAGVLETRLKGVEQKLRELDARPTTAGVDPKTVDDLAARVGKLETALANPRQGAIDPALANRMATLEGQFKAIDEKVGVVARRTDDIGTIAREARERVAAVAAALAELTQKVAGLNPQGVEHSEVEALARRIAALETSAKAMAAELGKRVVPETSDRAARLASVAAALNGAVERGEPFAAPLAAVKALGADPKTIAPLEPFAASGLPSASVLSRELIALLPTLTTSAGVTPRDGGFFERLRLNAAKIVKMRPVEDVPGDDPAAILTRIEVRASQSDIAGALAEIAKLPQPAREAAATWIAKAQARTDALAASRKLAADAFAALGKAS